MKKLKEFNHAVQATQAILEKIQSLDFSSLTADGRAGPSLAAEYLNAANRYLRGRPFTCVPEDVLREAELINSVKSGEFRFDIDLWVDGIESDLTATFYIENVDGATRVSLYDLRVL